MRLAGRFFDSEVVRLLVIVIGAFMAILDSSIVNVALPAMMKTFGVGAEDIQWVVTIYLLTLGVVVPASGWLGDRMGYKNLYMASLALFTFGSLLCGLSWDLKSLIAARVVQAVGGGVIMPTTMAMVYKMVPRERIGAAMGLWGLALIVGPAVGPTAGGYLVEYVNWRLIFTINIPIGAAGLLAAYLAVPRFPRAAVGRFDLWGFLAGAAGLFLLLLALSEGEKKGWTSEYIVFLFYFSAVFLAAFILVELCRPDPLLDLRVFRYGIFTLSNIVASVMTISLAAGIFYVPIFLQTVRGLGALETGLLMMPAALVTGLFSPISGKMYDLFGPKPLALAGLGLMAGSTYLFAHIDISTPTETIMLWMIARGVGIGLSMMPAQTAGLAVVPGERISHASAVSNIVQRVASSFGIAVFTSLFNKRAALHGQRLAESLTYSSEPVTQALAYLEGFFRSAGVAASEAKTAALGLLSSLVMQESFVRAIDDVFLVLALFTAIGLLPAALLGRERRSGAAAVRPPGPPE